ncbi:MAG: glutathione ABC transporter substrate-binding protein [Meiothermus sp.]|uniref:Glutathione ABC transporter substrate-binding protein n=2 Tax=Meiothermus hypogaeus TaxID=884155 RepID=A0A511R193_9DEIN|nr:ABC transporter substrate-binding protein [Meiothermus hypogaeus]RIH80719.1 Glutathione-binding protein GsiB [Meiothermus hypogaeus]GEM82786.1 glutathione ABC transporter substrate-binding protein [Meiothermus hypogaeus NBRC 106114]GIW37794.1 MAG: glutathione ABC transporter substrate-binding protein [Meiothermus sp.]
MNKGWIGFLAGLVLVGSAWAQRPDTIVIAQGVDVTVLDPNNQLETPTANVLSNIFDTLYMRMPDGTARPWLATGVRAINPTTWEMTIRQGVKFHNGEELTAETVKWNFDRVIDPQKPLRISNSWANLASVQVINPTTLRFTTRNPFPVFVTRLTGFYILPQKYVTEGGNRYLQEPVGTGPYKFVRWVRDQQFELEANPNYWGGAPKIRRVIFRPIPEASSRVAELVSGGVDIITNLVPEAVNAVRASGAAEVRSVPSIRNIFIMLNTSGKADSPLANPKVRLALNYAVDKRTIVKNVLGGFGQPTGCSLNSYIFGYDARSCQPYEYNPARAKQLLAEAGYPNGFTMTMGSPNGRYLNDRQVAEALVGQLAQVGVRVELRVQEWSTYVGQILERRIPTDAVLLGWGNNEFDADNSLYSLFYGGTVRGGPRQVAFSYIRSVPLDNALLQAQRTTDPDQRKKLYLDALRVLRAEAPWIFLHQQEDLYGVAKRVDWKPRPDERLFVADMALK